MPGLKEVKSRISSVVTTQQITKAMRMVSASKLRRAQDRILQVRPFSKKLSDIMFNTSNTEGAEPPWYSQTRPEKNILLIVVGSDRGLCGSFNASVAKAAVAQIQDRYSLQLQQGGVTILPIGKKMHDYFGKRGYRMEARYTHVLSRLSFDRAAEVAEFAMEGFKGGSYDRVDVVYNEFKNAATQLIQAAQLLPKPLASSVAGGGVARDYIYQPSRNVLIDELAPKAFKVQLFRALLDSDASEHGARMTAMDKASENAGELLKELRLTYNRTRQAMITKEILEIVGGAEALKSS